MNKQEILGIIIDILASKADNFAKAAKIAHADATNEQSKAENKYDTRSLEASYLAGAQAKMAAEAMQNLDCYKNIALKDFSSKSPIALTALVELEAEDESRSFYFIGPNSGGVSVQYNGIKILLITPSSPLGGKLIGRYVGDSVTVQIGSTKKEYEVISIR